MRSRRAIGLFLASVALLASCTDDGPPAADATSGCAAAEVVLGHSEAEATAALGQPAGEPLSAKVGDLLTVRGAHLVRNCADGSSGEVIAQIRLFVVQGSTRVSVARVAPQDDGTFGVPFGVPPGLTAGPAALVVEDGSSESITGVPFTVAG